MSFLSAVFSTTVLALAAACASMTSTAGSSERAGVQLAQSAPPSRNADAAVERRRRMAGIGNWGYWLSDMTVDGVIGAPHDLLVIDSEVSANRTFERELSSADVARIKRRPDGSMRMLLAYLSIGEAERYRPYWQADWYDPGKRPPWLSQENRRWVGNYLVQYWDPAWQDLIYGSPASYVDRVVAQGFDGVYLDRADAFFQWRKQRPSAQQDMVEFIARLSDRARKLAPQFVVVMQNAEELLEETGLMNAVDGIAKEDLLFGIRRAEEPNKPKEIAWSIELLQLARKNGRKVLVVEYLKDPEKMSASAHQLIAEGFVPYFAPRRLHCLNPPAVFDAAGKLPEPACR
jgi:cysteinyl-tRNA synthetase